MNEHFFLKGQGVITPDGKGEVVDATGDSITIKMDDGTSLLFPSTELTDDSNAG
ncbi:hypothetical protein INP83_16790 [Mucilaginibacter sp. 21P]|uniref:hypothetical protein n=1 Tax=Mucilaginibacter TaxID=423349 RepID=UPI001648772B|nr:MULTISPECIES: hypothetical protein [Mucilaginibacter]QXV64726.1 hypothetical protein INP83_16790 [Mucilaginibacter sp. 21P]